MFDLKLRLASPLTTSIVVVIKNKRLGGDSSSMVHETLLVRRGVYAGADARLGGGARDTG